MKKKFLIILSGILLLSPGYIKANYDPRISDIYAFNVVVEKKFKANCINPENGIESEITVKKDEVLKISSEGNCIEYYGGYNGNGFAEFCFEKNNKVCELEEDNIKNVHIQNLEFNVEENKNDIIFTNDIEAFPIAAYDEEYIPLYSGPSIMYAEKKKIKENSEIKVLGRLKEYKDWYYIETQNVKGWVENYLLMIKQNKEYINPVTQKIYKDKREKEIVGIIPANAIIKNPYYGSGFYINYNGIDGYIDGLYEKEEGSLILKYDGILYEEKDVDSKKLINDKIKKGQKINYDYIGEDYTTLEAQCEENEKPTDGEEFCNYHYGWYHTTIGEKSGWLLTSDNLEKYIKDYTTPTGYMMDDITIDKLKFTWNKANLNSDIIIDIKINNKTNYDIKSIYLIFKDANGNYAKTGCIDYPYDTSIRFSPYQFKTGDYTLEKIEIELNTNIGKKVVIYTSAIIEKGNYKMKILAPVTNSNNNISQPNRSDIDEAIKEVHKINNNHLIIGILSAISITITSIIFIILINKRRKDKSKN